MQGSGDEVLVLTDANVNSHRDEAIEHVPVKRIQKGKFLFSLNELEQNFRNDYDIINWNASGPMSALNFLRIKEIKTSLVWTLHSGLIQPSDFRYLRPREILLLGEFWNNILYSLTSRIFVKKAATYSNLKIIITLSKRLRDYLLSVGIPRDRVGVVYSGVDAGAFSSANQSEIERKKADLGIDGESTILYYGPMSPYRGVDELVQGIPSVLAKHPNSKFVFLGRTLKADKRSHSLKERISKSNKTLFVEGVQSQESIIQYLHMVDIVVLPFRFWPYVECPLTILETMAAGKPLVTTNIGAIPEVVKNEETGLLVRPRSNEIASAITRLLENENMRARIGHEARQYVKRFHSWDLAVQKTREAFQNCLSTTEGD